MGLPKVNKFLCCLELETGGIICGWLNAVWAAIAIILLGVRTILSIVHYGTLNEAGKNDVNSSLVVAIVVSVIYVLYFCVLFYAAVQLIRGTKNRNHVQMKLFLILMAIGVIISFLQIFMAGTNGIASAIISALISAYFFICIYSLYEKVKEGGTGVY